MQINMRLRRVRVRPSLRYDALEVPLYREAMKFRQPSLGHGACAALDREKTPGSEAPPLREPPSGAKSNPT